MSVVALAAALGVLAAAAAYTAGRLGYAATSWADHLYWFGQLLILAPVAARLLSRRTVTAGDTLTLIVILTVAEYLVKVCYSPAAFTYVDELMHWRSTTDIMQTGKLFTVNNLLPISPYYPGLEEVTSALASITGLSIFTCGLIVAGTAHLLFVTVLFVLFRHVSGSAPGRRRRHTPLCQRVALPVVRLDVRLPDARCAVPRAHPAGCLPARPAAGSRAAGQAGSRSPRWPLLPQW